MQGSSDLEEFSAYEAESKEEGEPIEGSISVLFNGVGHYDLLFDADSTGTKLDMPIRPLPEEISSEA